MVRVKIEPIKNISSVVAPEEMFIKIAAIQAVAMPLPRSRLTVPISPVPQPTGDEAFETPSGTQMEYLEQYELRHSRVGNTTRPDVEFIHDAAANRWGVRVTLLPKPPSTLGASANRMAPLDHEVSFTLSYKPTADALTRRERIFQDVSHGRDGTLATLWASSIVERDAFYEALTSPEAEAQLTAVRQFSIAVRADPIGTTLSLVEDGGASGALLGHRITSRMATADGAQLSRVARQDIVSGVTLDRELVQRRNFGNLLQRDSLPKPRVTITNTKKLNRGGRDAVEIEFTIRNIGDYGAALFRRKRPMNGLQQKRPARLLLEVYDPENGRTYLRDGMRVQGRPDSVRRLTFVSANGEIPKHIVFRLIDTQRNRRVESNKIGLSKRPVDPPVIVEPVEMYTVVQMTLPQVIQPEAFTFPAGDHPHIYASLAAMPPVPVQGGFARHRESYDGKVHSYFQDVVSPRTIFFLPDSFKIDRSDGVFRTPQATVRVRTENADTDSSEVTMDYVIAPYVDLARLSDAAEKIATATGINAADMEFQPYLTEDLSYSLSRPGVDGRITEDRPTSRLMLQEPMVDTLVLPVADFQIAFDAMVGNTVSVITGEITMAIDGWGSEVCKVILDFKDTCGSAMVVEDITTNPSDHAAQVNLTNVTASSLALENVVVMATRDGMTTPVLGLEGLNASTVLMPAESEPMNVTYPDLPGTGPVTFDVLKSGQILPDADAIMNAILDRSSLEYYREIDVRTVPSIFADPTSNPPADGIFALMVEFENGQAVVLDHSSTQQTVRVDFPFSDVILGHEANDGSYRYFVSVIRFDGSQERDVTANVRSSPVLFVTPTVNSADPAVPDAG